MGYPIHIWSVPNVYGPIYAYEAEQRYPAVYIYYCQYNYIQRRIPMNTAVCRNVAVLYHPA